ncbi:PREDICTED: cytosolic phospholipase A2 gamma [Elephantulus edwardii]|uniref:cytosolic phospholipase A2 gamma n=1 Tax=Elephantulus edwardii TaxID=28737 RepID=UPI0003F062D1|nr:PREDICTED: cytosolic phospholipase A2 gamma [Elephantulus edwardii]
MESPEVFIIPGLQQEEQLAVQKRSLEVQKALRNLSIDADEAPVITVLCSGGGLRAHIACLGVLSEMKEHSLLDTVTYLAAVSGSTWALSSFYANKGNIKETEAELKRRFIEKEWNLGSCLEKAKWAAWLESYSLTDFWAYMVVSKQTRELQDCCLSSMRKHVEDGTLPYPIFAAIDDDLKAAWEKRKTLKSWFEFTPHHVGYPALGAYISTTLFGSKFENGELVRSELERDMSFLKGLWGSALARIDDIKNHLYNLLAKLEETWNMKHFGSYSEEGMGMSVEKALVEVVVAYIEEQDASIIQEKFKVLQLALGTESKDEGNKDQSAWLALETVQNWTKSSEEERIRFMEHLVQSLTRQEQLLSRGAVSDFLTSCKDFVTLFCKTAICLMKWEWGTTHNFLHKHGGISDEVMSGREYLHLVDAGLAINTPYPLVLPPTRKAHLILSFDFSADDPFETLKATAAYCGLNNIPFPPLKETELQECAKAPSDCYIFKGDTGPVIMHFPLFNTKSCEGEVQKWVDNYGTIKLADSYTEDVVANLLEVSKKNVRNNKENILREIRNLTSDVYFDWSQRCRTEVSRPVDAEPLSSERRLYNARCSGDWTQPRAPRSSVQELNRTSFGCHMSCVGDSEYAVLASLGETRNFLPGDETATSAVHNPGHLGRQYVFAHGPPLLADRSPGNRNDVDFDWSQRCRTEVTRPVDAEHLGSERHLYNLRRSGDWTQPRALRSSFHCSLFGVLPVSKLPLTGWSPQIPAVWTPRLPAPHLPRGQRTGRRLWSEQIQAPLLTPGPDRELTSWFPELREIQRPSGAQGIGHLGVQGAADLRPAALRPVLYTLPTWTGLLLLWSSSARDQAHIAMCLRASHSTRRQPGPACCAVSPEISGATGGRS